MKVFANPGGGLRIIGGRLLQGMNEFSTTRFQPGK
jgi:hypothetical protein